jgi:hypothetical protein
MTATHSVAVFIIGGRHISSMMLVLAVVVICECLDHAAFAYATMTTSIHHSLQFGAKGCELADTPVDFAHMSACDAVGLRA